MKLKHFIFFLFLCNTLLGYSQNAFYKMGRKFAETGNYMEAIRCTKQSVDLDIKDNDKLYLFLDYDALSEYYSYTTLSDSCLVYAQKTLKIWEAVDDIDKISVLRLLSNYIYRAGFIQQAIDYRLEIIRLIEEKYGPENTRLINEYLLLSDYLQELGNKQLAIKYAKMQESLGYKTVSVIDGIECRIPYKDSFQHLIHVLLNNDEPIGAIHYLINCLYDHSDAIDDESRMLTCIAIWKILEGNNYMNDVIINFINSIPIDNFTATVLPLEFVDKIIDASPNIAEEYIQSATWKLYEKGDYYSAFKVAEKVLNLREEIYGKGSPEYFEWMDIMIYRALRSEDIQGMTRLCQEELELAEEYYSVNSSQFENTISHIRGLANYLVDKMPQFTTNWIESYYTKIHKLNILPKYQFEFEILQMEGYMALGNLKSSDLYAHRLENWLYPNDTYKVLLEDELRIRLKLSLYHLRMGDHMKARIKTDQAWHRLKEENCTPSIAVLIDRHNIEKELRRDSLGHYTMNSKWIIDTATQIIESENDDPDVLAFFYESRSYAYEYQQEFDKAISDIKKSIDLNPLIHRKKQLAKLYIQIKQYELGEYQYLTLLNDSELSINLRESIETDLIAIYWLCGNKEKMASLVIKHFENLKFTITDAFAFMNEYEREKFIDQSEIGHNGMYDIYTSFSKEDDQWSEGNELAYNLALMQKGLLLNTSKDIEIILKTLPDSLQLTLKNYKAMNFLDIDKYGYEDSFSRELRKKIMSYVSKHPDFLMHSKLDWEDIRNKLDDNESAIEFIDLMGISPEEMRAATPSFGALILRKDSKFPIFVKLATDSIITGLYEYGEDGERLNDMIYSGKTQKELYNIIWKPLLPYLTEIETVYYSPTGVLQDINLDWICDENSQFLSDKYNLYRLSSTRELCNDKNIRDSGNTVLYGDIEYSISNTQLHESPKSKYRSTTRNGFGPLNGTALEIDSITATLDSHLLPSKDFRKDIATEESFRALSGNSPKNIHIATHGFYYSNEALESEYKSGNNNSFIAFQGINPELYHSGLALSGAQDTWTNETEDIQKYIDMDSDNDGILLSSEISKLDLSKTDLVVLSACETALGSVKSEGVYGLQRAFKLAGVNSIIMSLWKVDDEATQILMTEFYKNYLNGMTKREALLTAQKSVREDHHFEDPSYWAAFILLDGLN